MINYSAYRKLSTLKNGKKILVRVLTEQDREWLLKLFQYASQEDLEFCKEDLKNPQVVDQWLNQGKSGQTLSMVAIDPETDGLIAAVNLYRGQQATLKVGEIQHIFVSRSFQRLGLGSLMLDELLNLVSQEEIHWLKAEVPMEQERIIKAFLARNFEIRGTLEDSFISKNGVPHDVALLMRPFIKKDDEDF